MQYENNKANSKNGRDQTRRQQVATFEPTWIKSEYISMGRISIDWNLHLILSAAWSLLGALASFCTWYHFSMSERLFTLATGIFTVPTSTFFSWKSKRPTCSYTNDFNIQINTTKAANGYNYSDPFPA